MRHVSSSPVPSGPARLRASHEDRERVAAVIREQWQAGRLTDEELEERLGRALSARTLGNLRSLVHDLPGVTSVAKPDRRGALVALGALLRRGVRVALMAMGILLVVVIVIGVFAGEDEDDPPPAPSPSAADRAASRTTASVGPEEKITRVAAGELGIDDGVAFRLLRVNRARSVAEGGLYEAVRSAQRGEVFLVATVDARNRTSRRASIFCGSNGTKLYTRGGRGYEPIDDQYKIEGNQGMCSGGLAPDESAQYRLVFQVPSKARAAHVELWNNASDGPDILGNTRLRVSAPA